MAKIQRKGEMIFWLMVFGAILLHHQSVFFYFDDYLEVKRRPQYIIQETEKDYLDKPE